MDIAIKEELARKREEVRSQDRNLVRPDMAAPTIDPSQAGPRIPVGPQTEKKESQKEEQKAPAPRIAQLDPQTVLRVELMAAKKKLADADEKMGLWAVQDARRRKQELEQEEAVLLDNVRSQLGASVGSNIRLVDKAKGLCQVE